MKKVFSVFAQNLAYYNEGYLVGDWIDLPQSPEVIDKYLKEVIKIDNEHEEYEIADVDEFPFPYPSAQWSNIKELNELAIIYSSLDEFQKEAISAHLSYEGEEHYGIDELINICLQADDISYYHYYFEGIEYNQYCSPELKMGYTASEENGLYEKLSQMGIVDFFDFEEYGASFGYDYELMENGYLISDYNLDLNLYSKENIEEKVNEILQKNTLNINVEMEVNK